MSRLASTLDFFSLLSLMNNHLAYIFSFLLITNIAFSETPNEFINKYLEIRNNENIEQYLKLIHPKCLAYFSNVGKPDFPKNIFLAFRKRLGPTPQDAVISISEFNQDNTKLVYPIKPTHTYTVSWKDSNGNSKAISESDIVLDNNTYYIVIPDYPK